MEKVKKLEGEVALAEQQVALDPSVATIENLKLKQQLFFHFFRSGRGFLAPKIFCKLVCAGRKEYCLIS